MNIVLCCDSTRSKGAIVISEGGIDTIKETIPFTGANEETKKIYLLKTITKGLKYARSVVNHEDLLLIEVSNSHLVEWLNKQEEYKGYEKELGELYGVLETLDCRYLFSHTKCKRARRLLDSSVVTKETLSSALDILNELE